MNFPEIVKPGSFSFNVKRVKFLETHISWVFLTGKYAFKVKKPVKWSLLDYTTPEARKECCEKEVRVNKELCSDVYEAVVPVFFDGKKAFFEKPPAQGFEPIDYAIKMKELPQDALLSTLLKRGKAKKEWFKEIARLLAGFHAKARTSPQIKESASVKHLRELLNENLVVASRLSRLDPAFVQKIQLFLDANHVLFEKRLKHAKDCHGDCHAGNIFVYRGAFWLFDRLEYDEWRWGDTARDVALMIMDLEYNKQHEFSELFLNEYLAHSKDESLQEVLPFYKAYYAFVRGLVNDQRSACLTDRDKAIKAKKTARAYYKLAASYL